MDDTRRLSRHIVVALLAGILAGLCVYWAGRQWPALEAPLQLWLVDGAARLGGDIFLALLKMLVVPLVLVSLVAGIAASGDDIRRMGRIGVATVGLYLLTTAAAVSLALLVAGITRPGEGVALAATQWSPPPPVSALDQFVAMFPSNPFAAMAKAEMLQVIVFALLLGTAIARTGERGRPLAELFARGNDVVLELVQLVMKLAPLGVFCLLLRNFAERGPDIFAGVAVYVLTVMLALALHVALTQTALLALLARVNPLGFWRRMREPMLLGFSTASSGATLAVNMQNAERRLGLDRRLVGFALPLGATVNMNGTAIMQGVATLFIAQAHGIELGAGALLAVVATATLASIGTAAVPGVGLVTLTLVLDQVGLPAEAIGLILGVDRLLDMLRTAVNVADDVVVAMVVGRREGMIDEAVYAAGGR